MRSTSTIIGMKSRKCGVRYSIKKRTSKLKCWQDSERALEQIMGEFTPTSLNLLEMLIV